MISRFASGIIPACAGSSKAMRSIRTSGRDHPRVCGEQPALAPLSLIAWGSSPRVRGAVGKRYSIVLLLGIIPACAGSSLPLCSRLSWSWDHPRVCGEQNSKASAQRCVMGSSPRVRGAVRELGRSHPVHGIIPACAGSRLKNPSSKHPIPLMWAPF